MNTTEIGIQFENLVHDLYLKDINDGNTVINPKIHFKTFQQKKYYSGFRKSNVEFDIAIEVYQNPALEGFSNLVLIECKDYTRNIGINEVSKFIKDIEGVAYACNSTNIRGIMAVKTNLSSGAFETARIHNIGLMKISQDKDIEWLLNRQFSSNRISQNISAEKTFVENEPMNINNNSKMLIFMDNKWYAGAFDYFATVLNISCPVNEVPFMSKPALEKLSTDLLIEVSDTDGYIDLDILLSHKKIQIFSLEQLPENKDGMLGGVDFLKKEIYLYSLNNPHEHRDRFTLAHELAHIFLGHGEFLEKEFFNNTQIGIGISDSNINRMEFQANYLASCLLMPKTQFITTFCKIYKSLGIKPRGNIILYKDSQEINRIAVNNVEKKLSRHFNVSKQTVELRLKGLELIQGDV